MIGTLFLLICGHFLVDYALQSEFIAKAKNRNQPIPGIDWQWVMTAHCAMHAGVVYLITGSILLGLIEFVAHFVIDVTKCDVKITFNEDQYLHIVTKVLIWLIFIGISNF